MDRLERSSSSSSSLATIKFWVVVIFSTGKLYTAISHSDGKMSPKLRFTGRLIKFPIKLKALPYFGFHFPDTRTCTAASPTRYVRRGDGGMANGGSRGVHGMYGAHNNWRWIIKFSSEHWWNDSGNGGSGWIIIVMDYVYDVVSDSKWDDQQRRIIVGIYPFRG